MEKKAIWKKWWLWLLIVLGIGGVGDLLGLGGTSPSTTGKQASAQNSASQAKTKESSTGSRQVTSAEKYGAVKLGMTKSAIEKITGAPKDKTEASWIYEDGTILNFRDNKLTGGTLDSLKDAIAASISREKASASDAKNKQLGFAQSFGQKTTKHLAKMSSVYHGEQIGEDMYYTWHTGDENIGMLVRIDSPDRMTAVYQYAANAENHLGKRLFSGRTLFDE